MFLIKAQQETASVIIGIYEDRDSAAKALTDLGFVEDDGFGVFDYSKDVRQNLLDLAAADSGLSRWGQGLDERPGQAKAILALDDSTADERISYLFIGPVVRMPIGTIYSNV